MAETSGVLVVTKAGRVVQRTWLKACPNPDGFPKTLTSGNKMHFFPGASLTRFPKGTIIKEIKL